MYLKELDVLKSIKVMKEKERLRNCHRLKETKEKNRLIQCVILDWILDQKKDMVVLLLRFGYIICRLVNNILPTIFSYNGYVRCYHLKKLSAGYMEILYTVFFLCVCVWATFLFLKVKKIKKSKEKKKRKKKRNQEQESRETGTNVNDNDDDVDNDID